MTPYDAAMAGVVVAGMIWGAIRGITWQVASIASLVLGYLFAYPLSAQLAPHFPGDPPVARALALLAAYAAVSAGVFLMAWTVRATLRRWKFDAFDRHLGMILGGLEGASLGVIVTLFVVSLAPQTREPIFSSPSGRLVGQVMSVLEPVLPGEIRDMLSPSWTSAGSLATQEAAPSSRQDRPATNPRLLNFPPLIRSSAPAPAAPARRTAGPAASSGGSTADLPSFGEMLQQGQQRLGRAVVDELERRFDQTTQGDESRNPERR